MAVAYVRGVQGTGVACSVKHLVGNDQEHERMSVNVEIDERALREIYLAPFAAAVGDAGVWSVMAAYNRFRGTYCSENAPLLTQLLRDEWGFDGVVVSDYFGTHATEAVEAGLDLEMPGPPAWLGDHLLAALEEGSVSQAAVDAAADRVLGLVARTQTRTTALPSRPEPIELIRTRRPRVSSCFATRACFPSWKWVPSGCRARSGRGASLPAGGWCRGGHPALCPHPPRSSERGLGR